ncbi:MAG: shikimate dehydrogenase [Methanosarcinales archaeon]
MKTIYGVLGYPIKHSLSPAMHNAVFKYLSLDCSYYAFEVNKDNLKEAIYGAKALKFGGLNLTIPLKEKALEIVSADPLSKKIGSINTIDFKDGIKGYTTDGIGAKLALEPYINIKGKNLLLLGAGGAARAIAFQFKKEGADIVIANRTKERAIKLAKEVGVRGYGLDNLKNLVENADIIINSTSVGMYPNTNHTLIPSDWINPDHVVFDIVYNPIETKLLEDAKKAGAKTLNGVMMLVYQGAESFKIWTGIEPPIDIMKKAVLKGLRSI